jgi:hypothetical protein
VQVGLGWTLLSLSFLSVVTLISGAIWWSDNDRHRRRLTRRIDELELAPQASAGPDGAFVGLTGRF